MKKGTKFIACPRCEACFKIEPGNPYVVPPHKARFMPDMNVPQVCDGVST